MEKLMSRDITEKIDDICSSEYGHTNWAFADTLSDKELKEIKDKKLGDKCQVLFFILRKAMYVIFVVGMKVYLQNMTENFIVMIVLKS